MGTSPLNNREAGAYRGCTGSSFDLAFSHNFCLRDVAWIHPAYVRTKRGDVGTTSPTVLARQKSLPKQSKHRFASLQHTIAFSNSGVGFIIGAVSALSGAGFVTPRFLALARL